MNQIHTSKYTPLGRFNSAFLEAVGPVGPGVKYDIQTAYRMYKAICNTCGLMTHNAGGRLVGAIFKHRPPDPFLEQITGEVLPR